MDKANIKILVITGTIIFLIAPAFILLYMLVYNKRKKRHIEEKEQLHRTFDAELVKTQVEIREQTMQTIGADLHDHIGQLLSLTALTLGSIELENNDVYQNKINVAIDLTSRSIKELRLLGKLIQGEQLIGMGLKEAIGCEINWIEKAGQHKVIYSFDAGLADMGNGDKDLIIFRIVQEIFNNIIKHALATEIAVHFTYHSGLIHFTITDNGKGFENDKHTDQTEGMGLSNIRKRVYMLAGKIEIKSKKNEGTTINIIIPYL